MAYTDILDSQILSITLDRYQELMNLPEAAFNGLHWADDANCYQCSAIWNQSDRNVLAQTLKQAEEMRVEELGYYLCPHYVENDVYDFKQPLILDKKLLISIGKQKESDISIGEEVILGALDDPVTFNVATTVTDTSEIKIYYPGTDTIINPSSISISGGVATIKIPRSRLALKDLGCNPVPRYDDDSNFLDEIDIKRVYIDPCEGMYGKWYGTENCPGCSSFTDTTQLLYPRIDNSRLAIILHCPAQSCTSGTFLPKSCGSYTRIPDKILVSYVSGRENSVHTQLETIRLAHTLLPFYIPDKYNMCAHCWEDDRKLDPNLVMLTPYGVARGAIEVWLSDSRRKVGQGGIF